MFTIDKSALFVTKLSVLIFSFSDVLFIYIIIFAFYIQVKLRENTISILKSNISFLIAIYIRLHINAFTFFRNVSSNDYVRSILNCLLFKKLAEAFVTQ